MAGLRQMLSQQHYLEVLALDLAIRGSSFEHQGFLPSTTALCIDGPPTAFQGREKNLRCLFTMGLVQDSSAMITRQFTCSDRANIYRGTQLPGFDFTLLVFGPIPFADINRHVSKHLHPFLARGKEQKKTASISDLFHLSIF